MESNCVWRVWVERQAKRIWVNIQVWLKLLRSINYLQLFGEKKSSRIKKSSSPLLILSKYDQEKLSLTLHTLTFDVYH